MALAKVDLDKLLYSIRTHLLPRATRRLTTTVLVRRAKKYRAPAWYSIQLKGSIKAPCGAHSTIEHCQCHVTARISYMS